MNWIYFVLFWLLFGANPRQQYYEVKVEAIVGDEVITSYDLDRALLPKTLKIQAMRLVGFPQEELQKRYDKLRKEVLRNLINETLIYLEAKEEEINVTDEVKRLIKRQMRQFGNDPRQFETFLRAWGYESLDDYRQEQTKELMRQRIVAVKVSQKVRVSDAEIKEEFERLYPRTPDCPLGSYKKFLLKGVRIVVPKHATIGQLVAVYLRAAYECYRLLKNHEITFDEVLEKCGDAKIRIQKLMTQADDSGQYPAEITNTLEMLSKPSAPEVAEPIVVNQGGIQSIFIFLRPKVTRVCIKDKTEQQKFMDAAGQKCTQRLHKQIMKAWLSLLRAKYKVKILDPKLK